MAESRTLAPTLPDSGWRSRAPSASRSPSASCDSRKEALMPEVWVSRCKSVISRLSWGTSPSQRPSRSSRLTSPCSSA